MFKWSKDKLYRLFLSKIAYTLYCSWRDHSDDWKFDDYHLRHKKSDVSLWRGNGRWFFNVESPGSHRGFSPIGGVDRHILWHEHSIQLRQVRKIAAKKKQEELLSALRK